MQGFLTVEHQGKGSGLAVWEWQSLYSDAVLDETPPAPVPASKLLPLLPTPPLLPHPHLQKGTSAKRAPCPVLGPPGLHWVAAQKAITQWSPGLGWAALRQITLSFPGVMWRPARVPSQMDGLKTQRAARTARMRSLSPPRRM